ncbi:MAG: DUF2291 domain-containing protein [Actinomycetia bacterium]|nr:DUF2291 domain-containing protein [Actinomycetes bacterium]
MSRGRLIRRLVVAVVVVGVLAAMVLTTKLVTPGTTPAPGGSAQGEDPKAWAQANYDAKVVPAIRSKAHPWADLAAAIQADANAAGQQYGTKAEGANSYSYATTITGTLGQGPLGTMTITAPGTPSGVTVSVATGPAITTASLRDASGLLDFGMFQNQTAFQQASTELNNMVKREVLANFDAAGAVGKSYTIVGAFTWTGGPVVITPISIEAAA